MPEPVSFSVIMPLYNKELYLDRAIRSVIAQDWRNFELLVIDDGSTDNGVQILQKWLSDRRVRLIRQSNSGAGAARNCGLAEMKNSWAAFLDADDEWLPSHLRDLAQLALTYPEAGVLSTGYCAVYSRGLVVGHSIDRDSPSLIPDYYRLAASGHSVHISACGLNATVLARTVRFKENAPVVEDQEFFARVAAQSPFAYHPRISALYHHDTNGSVMANAKWSARLPMTAETLSQMLRDGVVPPTLRNSASAYLAWIIEQYALAGLVLGKRPDVVSMLHEARLEPIPDRKRQRLDRLGLVARHAPQPLLKLALRFGTSRWFLPVAEFLCKQRVLKTPSAPVRATIWRRASLPG